jgi:MFS family permease
MNQVSGFVLSFVIVMITFVLSAIAAGLLADIVGVWKKPVIGATAAFCVVISGYITAPSHKQKASALWLIIGAIAAWYLSNTSPYPEDQPTLIPLYATYISGFIALLLCIVWHKKYNKQLTHSV